MMTEEELQTYCREATRDIAGPDMSKATMAELVEAIRRNNEIQRALMERELKTPRDPNDRPASVKQLRHLWARIQRIENILGLNDPK